MKSKSVVFFQAKLNSSSSHLHRSLNSHIYFSCYEYNNNLKSKFFNKKPRVLDIKQLYNYVYFGEVLLLRFHRQ
jgi:hypothetical protein